jgi:hypothetical protein
MCAHTQVNIKVNSHTSLSDLLCLSAQWPHHDLLLQKDVTSVTPHAFNVNHMPASQLHTALDTQTPVAGPATSH